MLFLSTESTSISITSSHTFPVTIGDEVILTCRVVVPRGISGTLNLEWHQPNGTYRYASVTGTVGGRMVYDELRVGHITQSNVGEYSCTASLNGAVSSTITIPNLNRKLHSLNDFQKIYHSVSCSSLAYCGHKAESIW